MEYSIIGHNCFDIAFDEDTSPYYEKMLNNFYSIYPLSETIAIHYIDSRNNESYTIGNTQDINDYLDCLAVKEGINFVRFESGYYGFVGYYGRYENGFEIMPLFEAWKEGQKK